MPLAIAVGGASGGGDAQPPVAFMLKSTVTQTLGSNHDTTVTFDNVVDDKNDLFDGNYS